MNQHMMDEYKKRETQHIHLVGALKELNSIISASADLRGIFNAKTQAKLDVKYSGRSQDEFGDTVPQPHQEQPTRSTASIYRFEIKQSDV